MKRQDRVANGQQDMEGKDRIVVTVRVQGQHGRQKRTGYGDMDKEGKGQGSS
jgi:hypothetical protein